MFDYNKPFVGRYGKKTYQAEYITRLNNSTYPHLVKFTDHNSGCEFAVQCDDDGETGDEGIVLHPEAGV